MTKFACPNCGSKVNISETNLTLKRGEFSAEFKNIPVQKCPNCGEVYIPGKIAESLSSLAEKALKEVAKAKEKLVASV